MSHPKKAVTVTERDLHKVLVKLRDLRAWALKRKVDPWAFRQGLLMILHLDTRAALERGISRKDLQIFDNLTEKYVEELQLSEGCGGR